MTAGLMRRFSTSKRLRADKLIKSTATPSSILYIRQPKRNLANIRDRELSGSWFSSTPPVWMPEHQLGSDGAPPDERTLKLGKTIRTLRDHLPTLLASPLPQEILSPQITLHLFPSTHPHLPTVSGRIAYTAALWTAPVAWGCVPVVGNVKLDILSERMFRNGGHTAATDTRQEKLVVKWKTGKKSKSKNGQGIYRGISTREQVDRFKEMLSGGADSEFSGLFIFEFDEQGKIVTHTIEHAEEGASHDRTAKVISVTDWLLGRAWGQRESEGNPGLAFNYCEAERRKDNVKRVERDQS
ncbi:hypothetical protein EJ05DRAFT_503144 [Pseudovirgaria hyperparasitica]|uniref:Uncharacterized protein n=1 Tax=Pseudovirgaria hyperparasitica TaxID=470096 RepID=A0A6A6W275_9PEZI|nr:uncharacterized protein EJ05DRAFT_503144 [Pseudovirgaria hyperparasitica]KAF2755687.1 hypothetical protein EJ05DRAFT_503144 [Pseudovirgaria hyperparasitica]